jgi:hypothetical protein
MKTIQRKRALTFGELIAAVYAACDQRRAKDLVRLAVNVHVVAFRGDRRYLIS